jgi:predicted 3-demethylubiquinone-9 3-methyltransferase (glyoxalase superfamily)
MQKITPFLWFDNNATEAMEFYTSIFENPKVSNISHGGKKSLAMGGAFEIAGQQFYTLNGGPMYKFTPANSLFVHCLSEEEIDFLWSRFSEGGTALMALATYPFSKKYGWVQDKFGLSWQFNLSPETPVKQKITPFLMFVGNLAGKTEEAIHFYTTLFENSDIRYIARYEPGEGDKEGNVKHASFSLDGQDFMAMGSGHPHQFTFNEAFSLFVKCETQQEIDSFWEKLSDGGEKSRCGWLKDKYGVSWQITPPLLGRYLGDPNRSKAQAVLQAMMKMDKIIIADLKRAYDEA